MSIDFVLVGLYFESTIIVVIILIISTLVVIYKLKTEVINNNNNKSTSNVLCEQGQFIVRLNIERSSRS